MATQDFTATDAPQGLRTLLNINITPEGNESFFIENLSNSERVRYRAVADDMNGMPAPPAPAVKGHLLKPNEGRKILIPIRGDVFVWTLNLGRKASCVASPC